MVDIPKNNDFPKKESKLDSKKDKINLDDIPYDFEAKLFNLLLSKWIDEDIASNYAEIMMILPNKRTDLQKTKMKEYLENDIINDLSLWDIKMIAYANLDLNKELKNINYIPVEGFWNFDLHEDKSMQKFVDPDNSFNSLSYVPNDLVDIKSEYIKDFKEWKQPLRKEAFFALNWLAKKFNDDFWLPLPFMSWYRSYDYQLNIKKWWCPDNLCAKAWFSEHQSGLAVDLFAASTNRWKSDATIWKYYLWLEKNAHEYWFHNTYQKWVEVDWYNVEPWHWRYVWVELATYLKENDMTLAEFYKKKARIEAKKNTLV